MNTEEELDAHDLIYGDQFAVQDYYNNIQRDIYSGNYELGAYQKCCIGCGKFWSYFCIGWNVLTCCLFLKKGKFLHQLKTNQAGIVQQFGRYVRMLHPGLNLINPCSQQVIDVDLRIKSFFIGKQHVLTKDNISLTVEGAVYYRIVNPQKAVYRIGIEHIQQGIQEAACDVIRNSFGQHILDDILMARNNYIELTRKNLQNKLENRGIFIQNIFLTELQLPQTIKESLNMTAKQKRLSQATIITSQAKVVSAQLIRQSSEILNSKAAMQIRYLQMLQQISNSGKEIKVVLPVGINSVGSGYN